MRCELGARLFSANTPFAANPYPSAWLFSGPAGTGKTTMALAQTEFAKQFAALYPQVILTGDAGQENAAAVGARLMPGRVSNTSWKQWPPTLKNATMIVFQAERSPNMRVRLDLAVTIPGAARP